MSSYEIVNGIPRPLPDRLEKIDFDKIREQQKTDPHHQLQVLGFSQKQSFILQLSPEKTWEEVKALLQSGGNKEAITNLAQQRGINI